MAVGIIKKIIPKVIKKAPKKVPKKKVKVPLEVKKGPRADKKDMFGNPLSEKGSPYQSVDELAAPLHRRQRYYPVGTEWKKLKEETYGSLALPYYVIIDINQNVISTYHGFDLDIDEFIKFLEKAFNK